MDIDIKFNHQLRITIIFLIILMTGIFLRIYNLGDLTYSQDELFSVKHASLSLNELVITSINDPHPPFYYIILHLWIKIFGNSEFATRSLSAVFGIISIILIYYLGNLIFNKETGIIASLILAISTFHITYSQQTRMYSLMSLFTLLSMICFIKMLKEYKNKFTVYYLLSSISLLYSHVYGFFIILAQNLYLIVIFIKSKKENLIISIKKWIILQILLFVAFIPWILVLAYQIIGIKNGSFVNISWLSSPKLSDIYNTFSMYTYYDPITLGLFSLLSLIGLFTWKKFMMNKQRPDPNLFLWIWLFAPIFLPLLISGLVFPIYFPKYTISSSLAFYMLTSRGVSQIPNKYLKIVILAAVIFFSLTSIIYNSYN